MLKLDIQKKLNDFHLHVVFEAEEQVVVLYGPSGSGKSTTIKCIAGLITPDAGFIKAGSRVIFDSSMGVNVEARHRHLGCVFQDCAIFPHMTVAENIGYGLHQMDRKNRALRISEALEMVQLGGYENRRPGQLSGGQKQRVALARALARGPEILLLDEPFAFLDSSLKADMRQTIVSILRDTKVPAVLVTHDLDDVDTLSCDIAVYHEGQVVRYYRRGEME